jgi:hypothetical protein
MVKNHNIYISGPMTGIKDYNYPEFFKMEEYLVDSKRFEREEIRNPARIDDDESIKFTKTRSYYIRKSIEMILDCEYYTLLPGWHLSLGAKLEVSIAQELQLTFLANPWCCSVFPPSTDLDIMKEAAKLVSHDRQSQYGHPVEHFTDVGRIWGSILRIPDISPQKIGLMMTGLKIARESFKHKDDNLVDAIGYIKTVDIIERDLTQTVNSGNIPL